MSHILICGAAGYSNLGDDAILWGMLTQLRAMIGEREIRVVGGPGLGPLIEPFRALAIDYNDRAELARNIEDADLVLLGGGGMLFDIGYDASLTRFLSDPPDRQWLYELARIAAAARAAGKPVMVYGMGVGPLITEAGKTIARFIGEQATAITVRDVESADLLAACGLPRTRVIVAADPAVEVSAGPKEQAQSWLQTIGLFNKSRPWVALNFRPWYRFGREAEAGDSLERMITVCGEMVKRVCSELGGTVVMLPFQHQFDDDSELMQSILSAAGSPSNARLLQPPSLPPDLIGTLACFDVMVGMRMHALLMAMNAGLPFVGLAYERKVAEFVHSAGLGDYLQRIESIDMSAVISSCRFFLERREEISAKLAINRKEMQEAAKISTDVAAQILTIPGGTGVSPVDVNKTLHLSGTCHRRDACATATKELHVLMQIRPDYQTVPGGDVLQLTEIAPLLREAGVQVQLTGELTPDLDDYDLVHTINLDRPEEPYQHCLNAWQQGKPIVVSPVHTDMAEFLEWGDTDYWELPDPSEGLPHPCRAPLSDPIERRRRARLHLQRQAIINWATGYLPNAQLDAEFLHRIFGLDLSRTVVVHHGIAPLFFEARPELFIEKYGLKDFVICVARIEKKKNQLSLIAALRGTGIPLVIVGRPNPEEYYNLCQRYADDKVLFLDSLSQEELASAYAAAKVHALVSWFELPGLVSLEAGAAGCNIVATDRGSPREYFKDLAWYCDPYSVDAIREAVMAAYQAPRSESLRNHLREFCSWERAAERTRQGYKLALAIYHEHRKESQEALLEVTRRHADWLVRLAADRQYEAERAWQWGRDVEAELVKLQEEFRQVTSRRLNRWSSAAARAGWSILRALRVKP